jgi:hypothetical protein
VSIPPVAGQHGQHHGAEQVAFARGIRAGQVQRTIRHPGIEQVGLLQKVDEEWQLSKGCHRRRIIPFDVDPAGERVHRRGRFINWRLFTRGVRDRDLSMLFHSRRIQRFCRGRQSSNCRI